MGGETVEGRARDLGGGFKVRRVLPAPRRQMVGPFIFWDHFGPVDYAPGERFDVRPHPHINLATVTYLFDGEIFHRDSLGNAQATRPGAVNWMSAGRGIVHSERTSSEVQKTGQRMEGIQAWVALPKSHEESDPTFVHHPAESLPTITQDGARLTLIAGTAFDETSPVEFPWPIFYVDVIAVAGASIAIPDEHEERAVYVARGEIEVAGVIYGEGTMLIVESGSRNWTAKSDARVLMLGGKPIDGPRNIWWNFVSSDVERIKRAQADWKDQRYPDVPGDDEERIPLPDGPPLP